MEWRLCNNKFYLSRLAGYPYINEEQAEKAAIGSAFDACIKEQYADALNLDKPTLKPKQLYNSVGPAENRDVRILAGQHLAVQYEHTPAYKRLLISPDLDIVVDRYKLIDGVALFGKLDFTPEKGMPGDWKVRFTTTPTKGYTWNSANHSKDADIPLEEANEPWAIQMLFYSWLLGNPISGDHPCLIHEICQDKKAEIAVYEHYKVISKHFSNLIWGQVQECWENICNLYVKIKQPTPAVHVCEKWGSICKVASRCNSYGRTLHPVTGNRENYV